MQNKVINGHGIFFSDICIFPAHLNSRPFMPQICGPVSGGN